MAAVASSSEAPLCSGRGELVQLIKRKSQRVTVQGWVCKQVWEPQRVHAGVTVGGSGELKSDRQPVPLVCHTTQHSKLFAALTDPEGGLEVGCVYTLGGVIPKQPPKEVRDSQRAVDLHFDNFSKLERTGTATGQAAAVQQEPQAAPAAAPQLQPVTPEKALAAHTEGDTDICLLLDATCALPDGKGGWLLEDAAGTELHLTGRQLSAAAGQSMQQAFRGGALAVHVRASPVKLVAREDRIFYGVSQTAAGSKVQTQVAVLGSVGAQAPAAGAGTQGGKGKAKGKRKAGGAGAGAAGTAAAAAGGGKAAKRGRT